MRLEKVLFEPISSAPYAVLRIFVGIFALTGLVTTWGNRLDLYSERGYFPTQALPSVLGTDTTSLFYWFPSDNAVSAVFIIGMLAALSFCVGLFTRLSGIVLYLVLVSIVRRNPFSIPGDEILLLLVLAPLLFTSSGSWFSMDSHRTKVKGQESSPLPLYLLRLQLVVAYFFSGFHKAQGDFWLDGTATSIVLLNPTYRRFPLDDFWLNPMIWGFMKVVTWCVIFWELTFFAAVCFKKTRPWALGFGLFLHTSQLFTIETGVFAPLMMSLYVVTLSPDWVERFLVRKPQSQADTPSEIIKKAPPTEVGEAPSEPTG